MPILLTMAETFLPPLPIAAGTSLSSMYTTALVSLIISTSTAPSVYLPISRWISFSLSFQPGRSSDGARGVASGMDARELPGLLTGKTGWPPFWDKGAFATGAAGAAGIPVSTGMTMVWPSYLKTSSTRLPVSESVTVVTGRMCISLPMPSGTFMVKPTS